MDFKIKETELMDGSKVFDVDIFANGDAMALTGPITKPMCVFSCTSENDASNFFDGLNKLVEKHTLETLNEI